MSTSEPATHLAILKLGTDDRNKLIAGERAITMLRKTMRTAAPPSRTASVADLSRYQQLRTISEVPLTGLVEFLTAPDFAGLAWNMKGPIEKNAKVKKGGRVVPIVPNYGKMAVSLEPPPKTARRGAAKAKKQPKKAPAPKKAVAFKDVAAPKTAPAPKKVAGLRKVASSTSTPARPMRTDSMIVWRGGSKVAPKLQSKAKAVKTTTYVGPTLRSAKVHK